MARRLPQTPGDYLAIGISPALIMLLVGSLAFFLVEVFYQSPEYRFRLSFIFAMFVMGAVAVSRISMTEGGGYAALFGAPLALVVGIALMAFVRLEGPLAFLSLPINMFLIALVWWCAHRLTWDCTLIDDSQDASGQGLLQSIGLDGTAAEAAPVRLTLWQRWFGPKKKQHSPGVWVIYFSLAALPLFGMGQWFIPAANVESRTYTFRLLLIYVASALALLLTTSFLGLRRYLRQRQLAMPQEMAGVWVGAGGIMIVVLLIFCALLPRPVSWSVSQLPLSFTSPIKAASKWGFGKDGPQDDKLGSQTGPQSKPEGQSGQTPGSGEQERPSGNPAGTDGKSPGSSGGSEPPNKVVGAAKPADAHFPPPAQPPPTGQKPVQQSGPQNPPGTKPPSNPARENPDGKPGTTPASEHDPARQPGAGKPESRPNPNATADSRPPNQARPPTPPPSSPSSSSPIQQGLAAVTWLAGSVLKLMFYTVLAVVAAYFAWRYRKEILAAWRKFLDELRALWNRLFGRQAQAAQAAAAVPPKPVHKKFAEFADPFASGHAARLTPVELVRYTFEAVEAWGRDHDCPREPQQTPHEFAERLAGRQASLAQDAGILAEMYCRAAYASGTLPAASLQQLRQMWQALRTT